MSDNEEIDLDQNVTHQLRPQDSIFINFEKNWPKFISQKAELRLPVRTQEEKEVWEPIVAGECVFSADAGGVVPQVTLSWNETGEDTPSKVYQGAEESPIRFDLTVHYKGFERNYFTSVLSTEKLERFNIPSNSEMVRDTAAVALTGPALFPKLMDYNRDILQQQQKSSEIRRYTLVLRDLSPGLSYTIRLCRFNGEVWNAEKEYVFMTPVCPHDF